LQKLAVFFTPSATINQNGISSDSINDDDYLPSQVSQAINLLAPFAEDPTLSPSKPYLSASRLNLPLSGVPVLKPPVRSIKCGPRRLFRAAPAFLWRIRFLRYPGLAEKETILACFDIEIGQFAACNVSIDKIDLSLTSGTSSPVGINLPKEGQPGEQLTLIYKISPPSKLQKTLNGDDINRILTVVLTSTVLVSKDCLPTVKIKWKTALELPPSRPSSRSGPLSSTSDRAPHIGHDALTMTGQGQDLDPAANVATGVTLSVSAPEHVFVGETFRWDILVVNRSEQVQRVVLLPIPKRKHIDSYPIMGKPASSRDAGNFSAIASPVLDENFVYTIHKNSISEPSELVCLTPDVKIG
jgi:TRAPP trafficking subunit Trs65